MADLIDPAYRERMNDLAEFLDEQFNGPRLPGLPAAGRKVGFFLAVFPFNENGEQGRFNYISNADRLDVVTLLTEMRARFAGQPETTGRA